jgi:malic enzyme
MPKRATRTKSKATKKRPPKRSPRTRSKATKKHLPRRGRRPGLKYHIERDSKTDKEFIRVPFKGTPLLHNPFYNKGSTFDLEERLNLGLQGLLPPTVSTPDVQEKRAYENYRSHNTPLERYVYLMALHERDQVLFYRLLVHNLEEMLPIVYTPTVGLGCQRYSRIFRRPYGLYITPKDMGRMERVLSHAPFANVDVIVVTDNERILGLGDLGVGGMGIPIGKLALYTAAAGIHPTRCLPIDLDVGTNNEELLEDPLYLGVRRRRLRGEDYYHFVGEFVKAVRKVFPKAILQWEDFKKEIAFNLLETYRDKICSFNDDIQGTGGVVLGGVLAAMKLKKESIKKQRFFLSGAGASAVGISRMLVLAMRREGMSEKEAHNRIFLADSHGLLVKERAHIEHYKKAFAHPAAYLAKEGVTDPEHTQLSAAVRALRPTVLIGLSGTKGIFTREVVEAVAANCKRPMIMPLSNPTSMAECTPEEIYAWAKGRAVVATGSPFPPVVYEGHTYPVSQGNNVFVFPGLGLGVLAAEAKRIPDELFVAAGYALAGTVSKERFAVNCIYPDVSEIRGVSGKRGARHTGGRRDMASAFYRIPPRARLESFSA